MLDLWSVRQCFQITGQAIKKQLDPAVCLFGKNELSLVELIKGGLFRGCEGLIPKDQNHGHQHESDDDDSPGRLESIRLHLLRSHQAQG